MTKIPTSEINDKFENFKTSSKHEVVLSLLETIEHKVFETGKLISLTGDGDPDLSLSLEIFDGGPSLLIKILCEKNLMNIDDAEIFQDFITIKFNQIILGLPNDIREPLERLWGVHILVNGELFY